MLRGEHLAGAADAGLDFIEYQQYPVPIAELATCPVHSPVMRGMARLVSGFRDGILGESTICGMRSVNG